jgi:CO/xanthine dehydrogenase Mo-binding subunit
MKTSPPGESPGQPQSTQAGGTEFHTRQTTAENGELLEQVAYDFGLDRRSFVQWLGAGLLIAVSASPALAQRNGRRGGGGARNIAARIHLGKDGSVTVFTGKVEGGQGARAELTQAAAEELRLPFQALTLVMADTELVPDDGITAGSGTTPRTVRAVRQGAASAREALVEFACTRWNVEPTTVTVRDGKVFHVATNRSLGYADLASDADAVKSLQMPASPEATFTPVTDWKVMGTSCGRPNGRDLVTGAHKFPSDIRRRGMLHGKILRAPSYGARLTAIDVASAQGLKDVIVVNEDQFAGVAAPTTFRAEQALELISKTAKWETSPHSSSQELFEHLKQHASGGVPPNPFADQLAAAKKVLRQTYHVAYAQHAPLEPRVAVAEWHQGNLTVWTGTQNPFGCRSELARTFHIREDQVRVVVPDFGAGFGGKHTAEVAIEAARLARQALRPVCLRWTRQEEFTWAYFRPAALIEAEASLDELGNIATWFFVNVNSGGAAVDTPYHVAKHKSQYVGSNAPLRQGSYRALAATANNFARESFMDELAAAADKDPLEFRLAHLENGRLKAVLESAAERFEWKAKSARKHPDLGVGLACGTEKGSYVAACAEVEIHRPQNVLVVRHVSQVFECGPVLNPENLLRQVQGAIIMGLGPALREEIQFEKGAILNASFRKYQVPRFADVPKLDIQFLNRPDLDPAGAGETPIIAIAPAIANAVFHATGQRIRQMPIRLS